MEVNHIMWLPKRKQIFQWIHSHVPGQGKRQCALPQNVPTVLSPVKVAYHIGKVLGLIRWLGKPKVWSENMLVLEKRRLGVGNEGYAENGRAAI